MLVSRYRIGVYTMMIVFQHVMFKMFHNVLAKKHADNKF